MTEKLDKLSNDILTLLKNAEPNRLRNHEICDSLWKSYQNSYKDKKSFGSAVSQKLTLLKAKRLIIHEDIWYGTLKSKISEAEKSKRFSFFEWWNERSERKRKEQKEAEKERLLDKIHCEEDLAAAYPELEFYKIFAKHDREKLKELFGEDSE